MANYVDDSEFKSLILEYRNTGDSIAYEKIGKIFISIVNGFLYRPNFVNYTQDLKDEATSDACLLMIKNINGFNEQKYERAFPYFNRITWFAILNVINKFHLKEKRYISISVENLNESEECNVDYLETYKVDMEYVRNEIKKINSYQASMENPTQIVFRGGYRR